jgi:hypothetical protein
VIVVVQHIAGHRQRALLGQLQVVDVAAQGVGMALRDSGAGRPSRFSMRTPTPPVSGWASIKSRQPLMVGS